MLDLWYKTAIIYGLNVGAFMDSDADGTGDFRGLTDRLDHLHRLGVNCLWLLPFFPSPRRDYGYDVTDFYNVAPRNGTLGDFVEFSQQAHMRGLRLLIDLPINHTSDQHPWFQEARSDRKSRYRDYFVWSEEEPQNKEEGLIFPPFQESVWTYDEEAGAWYYHRFFKHQPDLNIANPAVREEMQRIMGFWLQLGVSGFRIDAAPFLIEEVCPDGSTRRHYDVLNDMREFLSWRKGDAIMLAEANVAPDEIPEFVSDTRMHMGFAFLMNQYVWLALAREDAEPLARGIELAPSLSKLGQWAQFLRNHDELDLGRLSEDERRDVYEAFAPDRDMRLFGRGIRRRVASMLGNDRCRIELAFSLMFSLPGSPIIFYGDEIGMGEDLSEPERWAVRTCMQWTGGPNGGFSQAPADQLVHPVIRGGPFGTEKVNVVSQQREPDSLLSWMRRLCDVRNSCPEIGWGSMRRLETAEGQVFAHRYDWRKNSLVLLHNLGCQPRSFSLATENWAGEELVDLFGNKVYRPMENGSEAIELDRYGYRWLRVEKSSGSAEGGRQA